MKKINPVLLLVTVFGLFIHQSQIVFAASIDESSEILAGLVASQEVPALRGESFNRFNVSVDHAWSNYQTKLLEPLADWSEQELPKVATPVVFYPFSGPDFPTVFTVFPEADRYILVAIQRAGKPVDVEKLNPEDARKLVEQLGTTWQKFSKIGFFLTNDLDNNASRRGISISPTITLMVFASRLGFTVENVLPLQLNDDGSDVVPAIATPKTDWNSVRLELNKDSRQVIVDYVRIDLSDSNLNLNSKQKNFIETFSHSPTLFKAASYLPQNGDFVTIRNAVLKNSPIIVQDETGIDYGLLSKNFKVKLYGNFSRPHHLFSSQYQRSLANAFKKGNTSPLAFKIGYEKESGSTLQVAVRQPSEISNSDVSETKTAENERQQIVVAKPFKPPQTEAVEKTPPAIASAESLEKDANKPMQEKVPRLQESRPPLQVVASKSSEQASGDTIEPRPSKKNQQPKSAAMVASTLEAIAKAQALGDSYSQPLSAGYTNSAPVKTLMKKPFVVEVSEVSKSSLPQSENEGEEKVISSNVSGGYKRKLFLGSHNPTPSYSDYLQNTRLAVHAKLSTLARGLSHSEKIIITVTIDKSGAVLGVGLDRSSGNKTLDTQAINAIKQIKALQPLPKAITDVADVLGVVFIYPIET